MQQQHQQQQVNEPQKEEEACCWEALADLRHQRPAVNPATAAGQQHPRREEETAAQQPAAALTSNMHQKCGGLEPAVHIGVQCALTTNHPLQTMPQLLLCGHLEEEDLHGEGLRAATACTGNYVATTPRNEGGLQGSVRSPCRDVLVRVGLLELVDGGGQRVGQGTIGLGRVACSSSSSGSSSSSNSSSGRVAFLTAAFYTTLWSAEMVIATGFDVPNVVQPAAGNH
jgi:hypothetical protein